MDFNAMGLYGLLYWEPHTAHEAAHTARGPTSNVPRRQMQYIYVEENI